MSEKSSSSTGGALVPSGLVQGSAPHWIRPLAVSPSLVSMGLTDRLNDTVEVAACLQLIFECDWSTQWVAFHQCWADKGDIFIVVSVCVHFRYLLILACSLEEIRERKITLWSLLGLCRNLLEISFARTCLRCAIYLFIACCIYWICALSDSGYGSIKVLCLGQCVIVSGCMPCWVFKNMQIQPQINNTWHILFNKLKNK